MSQKKAVVLLSGGLDSSTVCAIAAAENREIYALTLDYNQRHVRELDAARAVARFFNVREHLIFPIDLTLFGGSSLTDDAIKVETDVPLEKIGASIPTSYVPARNTIFLSLALAFAETRGADEIWLGVNNVDYSGYPDCRPEYLDAFSHLAQLATKVGVEGAPIEIKAPLMRLDKSEIIRRGVELGLDYSLTRTCYDLDDAGLSCGRCEACVLRQTGFVAAGLVDPAPYRARD